MPAIYNLLLYTLPAAWLQRKVTVKLTFITLFQSINDFSRPSSAINKYLSSWNFPTGACTNAFQFRS